MAYRLVAEVEGRRLRLPLPTGEHLLGSLPGCPLHLDHPTVSRRHARVRVDADGVTVEDLGSHNGLRIDHERVSSVRLEPGSTLYIGAVEARLEQMPEEDLEVAVVWTHDSTSTGSPNVPPASTCATDAAERFALDRLGPLLDRLASDPDPATLPGAIGESLFATLPCTAVRVRSAEGGLLFRAEREGEARGEVVARSAAVELALRFPTPDFATLYEPLVTAVAKLFDLADQLDAARSAPRRPEGSRRQAAARPPLPEPPTLVARMRSIYEQASRVARGDVGVLVLGESGTGKEVLARYVHRASHRADGPFLGLNCAALPSDLLEAELFGIERGVATGVEARPGRFEQADGGSLFLDEIGDMALPTQAKILRVLQSGEVYRLGGRDPRPADVRIIAATNRHLDAMLSAGSFRRDLYHRIATWVVEIPPLRRRRADIANLAAYFLVREARKQGLRIAGVSRGAIDRLVAFPWPGNVRQLENEMARAVLFLEDGDLLDSSALSEELRSGRSASAGLPLAEILAEVERDEIETALEVAEGRVDEAAQRLGLSRSTLYRRMKALGIEPRAAP